MLPHGGEPEAKTGAGSVRGKCKIGGSTLDCNFWYDGTSTGVIYSPGSTQEVRGAIEETGDTVLTAETVETRPIEAIGQDLTAADAPALSETSGSEALVAR